MTKTIKTMECYSQYVKTKSDLMEAARQLESAKNFMLPEGVIPYQERLNELVGHFRFIIQELNLGGIDSIDLLLLAAGVEVDLFGMLKKQEEEASLKKRDLYLNELGYEVEGMGETLKAVLAEQNGYPSSLS